jgi:hypothetical protein
MNQSFFHTHHLISKGGTLHPTTTTRNSNSKISFATEEAFYDREEDEKY